MNNICSLLKITNICISIAILILAFYITFGPILPRTGYIANAKEWVKDDVLNLKRNKLQIASVGINGEIHEGDESALNLGFWRRPNTSTPDKGGNTVIVGHRYLYTYGPNTFFNLDKVKLEDDIKLVFRDTLYSYKVIEVKKVQSTDLSIEENTKDPILTLYTCTSLWDQSERLVIIAKKIEL